ncbi:hypothetical protein NAI42_11980, partial [Francisella tularensis subsp. holarctica]|uniref:hypothetical protein n=1 Tax=Francisella tularensis TaxID=263 RepID=UPI002381A83D
KVGEELGLKKSQTKLVAMQYSRNDMDCSRGSFRVRGEVLDIFPADSEKDDIRVEFFDAEIVAKNSTRIASFSESDAIR